MKKRARILVVDDEISVRGILRELFSSQDYEVVEAPNVEVALVKISSLSFDLIISDIRMGGQSGIALLKQVKEKNLETEVIIMTSHASVDTSLEAIRLGAYDYILKPFEELEYVEMIVARALAQNHLKKENKTLIKNLTQKNEELAKGTERAAQILASSAKFHNITENILSSNHPSDLEKYLKDGLTLLSNGKPAIFWQYQSQEGHLLPSQTIGLNEKTLSPIRLSKLARISEIETTHWFANGDYQSELNKSLAAIRPQYIMNEVLIANGKPYGLLSILNRAPAEWSLHEKNAFIHMAHLTAMRLGLFDLSTPKQSLEQDKKEGPRQVSLKDTLTPLLHYDYFMELLKIEICRARRFRNRFVLAVFQFSPSKDPETNPEFRLFLQKWAELILNRIRKTDMATRKGDQLIIVLPETQLEYAHTVIKSLKQRMGKLTKADNPPQGRSQWHIECAEYPKDGDTMDKLFTHLNNRIKT